MANKKVIVTGGLGYIGSHTVIKLYEAGFIPIIIDNLLNSKIETYSSICEIVGKSPCFYKIDLSSEEELVKLEKVFDEHKDDICGVIHFAGVKSVKESIENPGKYYKNNLFSTLNILKVMEKFKVNHFVFSSSCTVYGEVDEFPVSETTIRKEPTNPYGRTKYICEDIIKSYSDFGNISAVTLRYFNPIGAHPSGLIYDNPIGIPENLIPYIQKVIEGKYKEVIIFGNDYNTYDGTCIRDYVDVNDLAQAHINALKISDNKYRVYNIGSGVGYSVLEVIKAFKEEGVNIPYSIGKRRDGDVPKVFADITKAKEELGWRPYFMLSESIKSVTKITNYLKI